TRLCSKRYHVPGPIPNHRHHAAEEVGHHQLPFTVSWLKRLWVNRFQQELIIHGVHDLIAAFVADQSHFAKAVGVKDGHSKTFTDLVPIDLRQHLGCGTNCSQSASPERSKIEI